MLAAIKSSLEKSSYTQLLSQSLAIIGGAFLGYKSFLLLKHYYHHAQEHPQNLIEIYGHDSYVLITGGSDGLGKAFAMELARQGFNIILVARDLNSLLRVKEQIVDKYPDRDVRTISLDCAEAIKGEPFLERLKREI